MRVPTFLSLSKAAALGTSGLLLPGLAIHGGAVLPGPDAPPPPPPPGVVEVGPLTMGTSLPLELLTGEGPAHLPYDVAYDGAYYGGDTEGAEETAFFHLGGPWPYGEAAGGSYGSPHGGFYGGPYGGTSDASLAAAFGDAAAAPFGSAYPPPVAAGFADAEASGGGVEPFGAPRPAGRSLLTAPRPALPLLSLVTPTSALGPWLAALAHTDHEEAPLLPYVHREDRAAAGPLRVTLPPVFLAALGASALRPVFGGIDYTDPTGIGLPLLRVFGYEDAPLSPSFRVRDFATRDGAPLARISPRLVQGLERLRQSAGALYVISGYRHPAHNAAVGGSRISQHMAGQAADVWSPTRSPIELARAAVRSFGCGVGLGLGRSTLHVDVRGHLATWTYPGAPLSETAFDLWVLLLCDRVSEADLSGLLQVEWTVPDSLSDVDLLNRLRWLVDEGVPADSVTRESAEELLQRRRLALAAYARSSQRTRGPGAVLVDLTEGLPPEAAPLALSYVAAATPEADGLGITPLVEWVVAQRHQEAYFVYAVRFPGGHTDVGIMTLSAADAPPLPVSGQADPAGPYPQVAGGGGAAPAATWGIVVHSTLDALEAERDAGRYRRALAASGYPVAIRVTEEGRPRYRVVVGAFASGDEAQRALEASLAGQVPADAWLLPPGN